MFNFFKERQNNIDNLSQTEKIPLKVKASIAKPLDFQIEEESERLKKIFEHDVQKTLPRLSHLIEENCFKRGKLSIKFWSTLINANKESSEKIYLVMITGYIDSIMLKLAKTDGFPRGFPLIWIPNKLLKTHGFYPKFDNDSRQQELDRLDEFIDVKRLCFFRKFSGFLGQLIVFDRNDEIYWTACSKNSASSDSIFVKEAKRIFGLAMQNSKNDLLVQICKENLHICAEMLSFRDQKHGAKVLKECPVVTCVAKGYLLNIEKNPHCCISSSNPLVEEFFNHEKLVFFCQKHSLPCDNAIYLNDSISCKEFLSLISQGRDFMTNSRLEKIVKVLGEKVCVHYGTISHEEVLGDCLEGLVFQIENFHGNTSIKKYKFPLYTIRTMLIRTLLEKSKKEMGYLLCKAADDELNNYLTKWCVSEKGKKFWKEFFIDVKFRLQKHSFKEEEDPSSVGLHISVSDEILTSYDFHQLKVSIQPPMLSSVIPLKSNLTPSDLHSSLPSRAICLTKEVHEKYLEFLPIANNRANNLHHSSKKDKGQKWEEGMLWQLDDEKKDILPPPRSIPQYALLLLPSYFSSSKNSKTVKITSSWKEKFDTKNRNIEIYDDIASISNLLHCELHPKNTSLSHNLEMKNSNTSAKTPSTYSEWNQIILAESQKSFNYIEEKLSSHQTSTQSNLFLIIISGPQCMGKSTISDQLSKKYSFVSVSADYYMEQTGGFNSSKLTNAHKFCQSKALAAMSIGKSVFVDNTNTTRWQKRIYIEMALAFSAQIIHCTIAPNLWLTKKMTDSLADFLAFRARLRRKKDALKPDLTSNIILNTAMTGFNDLKVIDMDYDRWISSDEILAATHDCLGTIGIVRYPGVTMYSSEIFTHWAELAILKLRQLNKSFDKTKKFPDLAKAIMNARIRDGIYKHVTLYFNERDKFNEKKSKKAFHDKIDSTIKSVSRISRLISPLGVGHAVSADATNYCIYIPVDFPLIHEIRNQFELPPIHPHITLAFLKEDIHNIQKDIPNLFQDNFGYDNNIVKISKNRNNKNVDYTYTKNSQKEKIIRKTCDSNPFAILDSDSESI